MLFLFVVQYHPVTPPSAILDYVAREGLTEQQQNAVEEQIAAALMEEINYRVGGLVSLWVLGAGCCVLQIDY